MTLPPPVAWRYQPSKVWKDLVVTMDAKVAASARHEFGLEVEPLFTAEQMQAAVAAEREACAQVCDARYVGDNNREDMEARRCAAAIRARKD